MSLTIPKG